MGTNEMKSMSNADSKLFFSKPTRTTEQQKELFDNYHDYGYAGLQLKHNQYMPHLDEPGRFIEQWGHLSGVASALIASGTLDEANQAVLRRLFAFARSVNTKTIVYCHLIERSIVTREDIARFAGILSDLGKEAQEQGLQLSLHHHYNNPVMHREDFDVFFGNVAERTVGLTVDTAHLVKSGITDIAELVRSFGHVIDNFHLKDYANGDWMVLGEGDISFAPVFQAIRDIGFSGSISADEESGGGIIEGMRDCYAFIKNGLSAV